MSGKYIPFLLTIVLAFDLFLTSAQLVPGNIAIAVAQNFLASRSGGSGYNKSFGTVRDVELFKEGSFGLFYVINYDEGGYAVVSADYRFYPVLAFSFEGNFDINEVPDNCRGWIDLYASQMMEALQNNGPFSQNIPHMWESFSERSGIPEVENFVLPLMTCTWSQFVYYNLMCPPETESYNGHVPVGCVALAMAQLMYYYRFPPTGFGFMNYTPPYHSGKYGLQSIDFSQSEYEWSLMTDIGHDPNVEIAEICYNTGVSVQTSYSPESSGADVYDVPNALRTFFYYKADDYLARSDVQGTTDWVSRLINQLNNRQPVLYRSKNGWSGHVYICDGYQDSTHFHFNWGWGGAYNGYYYIDELVPNGIQLTESQGAVFNVYPDTSIFQYPPPFSDTVRMTASSGSIEDGSGPAGYKANLHRSWIIAPYDSSITNILLMFTMLETSPGIDNIRIYDGASAESPLLATLSGSDSPVSIYSSGPALFVTFESHDSDRFNGFYACYYGYHMPFCSGNLVFTDESGTLGDGSRYLEYTNNTDCEWTIAPFRSPLDSISAVSLAFSRFDLASGDTLYIFNGPDDQSPLLGKYKKDDVPGIVTTIGNKAFLRFVTDTSGTAGGCEIIWQSILPDYCQDSVIYDAQVGTISDGSGSMNYVENTDCHYFIDLGENQFINIEFLEFDLEENYDFVKLIDVDHPGSYLYRFSGDNVPDPVTVGVKKLMIYFHSDDRDNYSGWKLNYSCSNAIEETGQHAITISPNPVRDDVRVDFSRTYPGRVLYRIYHIEGQQALFGELSDTRQDISMTGLPAGIYVLELYDSGMSYNFKIVKCK